MGAALPYLIGGGIGAAAGSMMGRGGGSYQQAEARDPVEDYRRMYQMQADIQRGTGAFSELGPQIELERELRPQWMDLQTDTLRQAAEGMLPTYANQIQPQLSAMEAAANRYRRGADITDALSFQPQMQQLRALDEAQSRELLSQRRSSDLSDALSMQPEMSRLRELDMRDALRERAAMNEQSVNQALSLQPRMAELSKLDAATQQEITSGRRRSDLTDALSMQPDVSRLRGMDAADVRQLTSLGRHADMLDAESLSPRASALQAAANRAQRGADIGDFETFSQRAAAATLGADPLTQQASDLQMQRSMNLVKKPHELRKRREQIAASQQARGLSRSPFAAAQEAYLLEQESDEQEMRRLQSLGSSIAQRRALTGDTWGQVMGRPQGGGYSLAQGLGARAPMQTSVPNIGGSAMIPSSRPQLTGGTPNYATMGQALGGGMSPYSSMSGALGGGGQAFGAMGGFGGQAGQMGQQFGPQIFGESQLFQDILSGNQQQAMAQAQNQAMMNSARSSGMMGMAGKILGGGLSGGYF